MAREPQNTSQLGEKVTLGPWASHTWRTDPKRLGFVLARYIHASKILAGKERVLEVGCGDGIGVPILLQEVGFVHGIDAEPELRNEEMLRCSFSCMDITERRPEGRFDGALSLDVIEHIPTHLEPLFFGNVAAALDDDGMFVVGTPNITAAGYASPKSMEGHINLHSGATLKQAMKQWFRNVVVFSMNDGTIHTGFTPMAHYLLAVGVK